MTIAACYFSSEGVVLGADSTSTVVRMNAGVQQLVRHYDYAQKVFEVGTNGTLGVVTWGLGSFGGTSHRTLMATFSNDLEANPVTSVAEAADRLSDLTWQLYSTVYAAACKQASALRTKHPQTPSDKAMADQLDKTLLLGFCIGGTWHKNVVPQAFELLFLPSLSGKPAPVALKPGTSRFWGVQNMMNRLVHGIDMQLRESILKHPKWGGTEQELDALIANHRLTQPFELPLRDAIDWVHTAILTTIKALKFSQHAVVCGGPVEVAVVTSDRPFRWVTHKRLDDALKSMV